MPNRRGNGWSSVSALALLVAIAGWIQTGRVQAATAGCPAPPAITSTTYAGAVDELKKKGSVLTPRMRKVASAKPIGTILEAPKSELAGGTCYATFAVSDGSLAKFATVAPAAKVKIIPDKVVPPAPADKQQKPPVAQLCPQIPSFSPQTLSVAQKALSSRGIQYLVVYRPSSQLRDELLGVPQMDQRCIVTLVVSDGTLAPTPPPKTCAPAPDVVTQAISAALKTLAERGFRADRKVQPSAARPGTVVGQSPPELRKNTCFVTLTVSDGSLVRVPRLKGLLREQAKATTENLKLQFQATERQSDDPVDTVLDQQPPADTEVPLGSRVSVAVARPPDFDVPDVIGLLADDAKKKLSLFKVESVLEEGVEPQGKVTNQDPRSPATRKRGDTVRIFVSDGSLVEMPDVRRLTIAEARKQLDALGAGFSVTTTARDHAAAPDSVVEQSPPAKAVVKRGSGVALEISLGLPVPSVIGLQLVKARAELARFKVSSEYVPDVALRDEVVAQEPAPPARVARGAEVRLHVSDGSRVKVPDVRTMTLAAARSALGAAALEVQIGDGSDSDSAKVVHQTPPPRAIVGRGTSVRLDLEAFPPVWVLVAAAALGLLGSGIAAYKYWTKLLRVEARVDLHAAPTLVRGAERESPDISIEARLEPGDTTIKFSDGDRP